MEAQGDAPHHQRKKMCFPPRPPKKKEARRSNGMPKSALKRVSKFEPEAAENTVERAELEDSFGRPRRGRESQEVSPSTPVYSY